MRTSDKAGEPGPFRHAEYHMAFNGARGGELTSVGRPSEALVGVGTCCIGFDAGGSFNRVPIPEEVAFVFENVDGTSFGNYGVLLGGAVGQEWDNTQFDFTVDGERLVLARSGENTT